MPKIEGRRSTRRLVDLRRIQVGWYWYMDAVWPGEFEGRACCVAQHHGPRVVYQAGDQERHTGDVWAAVVATSGRGGVLGYACPRCTSRVIQAGGG